jgi:hypothetical protein
LAQLPGGQSVIASADEVVGGCLVSRATIGADGVVLADCMCFVAGVVPVRTEHTGVVGGEHVPIYRLEREVLS